MGLCADPEPLIRKTTCGPLMEGVSLLRDVSSGALKLFACGAWISLAMRSVGALQCVAQGTCNVAGCAHKPGRFECMSLGEKLRADMREQAAEAELGHIKPHVLIFGKRLDL